MEPSFDLVTFYETYPRIEERFRDTLDESLRPRGPAMLYDLVGGLGLPPGATVLDVGCGDGRHAVRLADQIGFAVLGLDPVPGPKRPIPGGRLGFALGTAERLPIRDGCVDLVWCRDVLVHVADLDSVYAEFRRVLREGGRALVYQMFGTGRLEPREAGWLSGVAGMVASSTDPDRTERAIADAGLGVDARLEIGPEWGEYAQENGGEPGRRLLHAARLLRDPQRYASWYGQAAYDIMLSDCLWHVYRMIGKLSARVYLLSAAGPGG